MIRAAGGVLWRYAKVSGCDAEGDAGCRPGAREPAGGPDGGAAGAGLPFGDGPQTGGFSRWGPVPKREASPLDRIEVAVLHRPKYDDWSLPKGKTEKGEQPWLTALREIAEETGEDPVLMAPLGPVFYRTPDGKKRVDYWLARVGDGDEPGVRARSRDLRGRVAHVGKILDDARRGRSELEIDEIRWLPLKEARKRLSYRTDCMVLDRAARLVGKGALEARTVAFVRHAKAESRIDWNDGERTRPLTEKGRDQAERIGVALAAWGIGELVSSPWERCMATLVPYADDASLGIRQAPELTEDAAELDSEMVRVAVRAALGCEEAAGAWGVAVCLHGPTLEAVRGEVAAAAPPRVRRTLPEAPWRKGEILFVHMRRTKKGTAKACAAEFWRP